MLLAIPEGEYAIRNLIRDKRIKFRRKTTYAEGKKKGFSEDYTHFKVVSGLLYSVAQA